MDEWLSTPESDEPVPDFVERDLEKPFEIDLSEWAAVELSPDFTDRVVQALAEARAHDSTPGAAAPKGPTRLLESPPKSALPAKTTPEDPPRPPLAQARPPQRRAAGSRG